MDDQGSKAKFEWSFLYLRRSERAIDHIHFSSILPSNISYFLADDAVPLGFEVHILSARNYNIRRTILS